MQMQSKKLTRIDFVEFSNDRLKFSNTLLKLFVSCTLDVPCITPFLVWDPKCLLELHFLRASERRHESFFLLLDLLAVNANDSFTFQQSKYTL